MEIRGISARLTCETFCISESGYRYQPVLCDENQQITDLLTELTTKNKYRRSRQTGYAIIIMSDHTWVLAVLRRCRSGSVNIILLKTSVENELGDKDAQLNLGLMYYQGDGVPVSIEQAQKWFMRAAEQGNAYAQYNLGWLMQKGEVENASPYAARYYFELACKEGLEKACFALEKSHSEHF